MGFLGVYRAVYDYRPQAESELAITEGDILYVLEKSAEDDWWKAKKKASGDDDEEPVGLIPNNYIEEAQPTQQARALYDYTRQTDEELSFTEDSQLEVFDTSDPDWILVGHGGEYGFAPANYISLDDASSGAVQPPGTPRRHVSNDSTDGGASPQGSVRGPAAALAGVLNQRKPVAPPPNLALPPRPQYTPEASDDESGPTPSLPARPISHSVSSRATDYATPNSPLSPGIAESPPYTRSASRSVGNDSIQRTPGGFTTYNINEMVSILGKRKKMPTTLGINVTTGTIMIAPDTARDGPSQEWTADRMTHHSIEGKHVFIELVRPSKSVDLHAGAREIAEEIDAALGEIMTALKAEDLRESLATGSGQGQKKGVMVYDFMAQGDDEVSVAIDDEVIILDNTKSDEWWMVRRVKNGKEGVVPSSYVEITGTVAPTPSTAGINAGRSIVEQNRLEEQRLAKESLKAAKREDDVRGSEVGPGMPLPERGSSLNARDNSNTTTQPRSKRDSRQSEASQSRSSKSKPDPTKVRTWTDRSKSFSVEAQFLALKDGKINLHKMNGVKIAVPVVKMSVEDLEYVERITGISLENEKPKSDAKKQKSKSATPKESSADTHSSPSDTGATVTKRPTEPDYDWFTFFLSCDVSVALCERYAQIFTKDSMDESVLPDVDSTVLRSLGIREGDIIKVMRYLDGKYNRPLGGNKRSVSFGGPDAGGEDAGGLFSGPGGALRNNTRKGRPAPAVQTNDVIDPKAFSQDSAEQSAKSAVPEPVSAPITSVPLASQKGGAAGFDDDAWDVKPAKTQAPTPVARPAQSTAGFAPQPALTGSMHDLSLLDTPLQPTKAQPPPPAPQIQSIQQQPQQSQQQTPQQQIPQLTGATPGFFAGVNQQVPNLPAMPSNGSFMQNPQFAPTQVGYAPQQLSQQSIARQRPIAPQFAQNQGSLMVPPPPRPLSAPQAPQQSTFGPPPLQPQRTGIPNSGAFNPQLAPPGQSLAEINQMRLQQQYIQQQQQQQQQLQQQMTGFGGQLNNFPIPQAQAYGQPNGFGPQIPQPTGFAQNQPFQNGQGGSPFADPRSQQFSPIQTQATGFQSSFSPQQYPQPTGINSFLPPALQPQQTGAIGQQQPGLNGYGQTFGQPPVLSIPQQPTTAPLIPQKTGPPPPVRFGVTAESKKLMPQATGRKANLAQSTPQNPFGF